MLWHSCDYVQTATIVCISVGRTFFKRANIISQLRASNLHLTNVTLLPAFGCIFMVIFGMVGKVLASGSRPATRSSKILRLEATGGQTSFQFEFWRQNQVYSCFLFSWLHHASVILVHSCSFLLILVHLDILVTTRTDRNGQERKKHDAI